MWELVVWLMAKVYKLFTKDCRPFVHQISGVVAATKANTTGQIQIETFFEAVIASFKFNR